MAIKPLNIMHYRSITLVCCRLLFLPGISTALDVLLHPLKEQIFNIVSNEHNKIHIKGCKKDLYLQFLSSSLKVLGEIFSPGLGGSLYCRQL